MPAIIIAADWLPVGLEVAAKTADLLGYRLVGREVLAEVASKFHVAEERLIKALESPPSLRMSARLQRRLLACIQQETLANLVEDRIVCHSLAAHLYVRGIAHVISVRLLADPEKLVEEIIRDKKMPPAKAEKLIKRQAKARRAWSVNAFKLDESDSSLYDLVIRLSKIDLDEAAKTIAETVAYRRFTPTTYSIKNLTDYFLASQVRAELLEQFPDALVEAQSGTVIVSTKALRREKRKKTETIKEMAGKIPGVDYVEVHLSNDLIRQASESNR